MAVCQCDGRCGECPSLLRKLFVDCRSGVVWVKPLCDREPVCQPLLNAVEDYFYPIPIVVCEACHIRLISTLEYVSLGPDPDEILADEEIRRRRWFGIDG